MRTGLLLLLLVARFAGASSGKFSIADVLVNGVPQQPAMIWVAQDGTIFGRRADVVSWNFDIRNAPVETLQNIDHVRLNAISGVVARFDGGTLTIEAAGNLFQGTRIDMQKHTGPQIDGGTGAYLNYDIAIFGGRDQRTSTAALVEGVAYMDALSITSNAIFVGSASAHKLVRYESTLRWDFPDRAQSLVAGDAISRSGALARAFRYGGISFGNNFSTRPDMVTFALPAIPGESRIPTSAELLINGQAHSRLDLAPGPFEISNVPAITGAGEIQLVTRDPLGRQQVLVVPYYVTPTLLRPGLIDAGFEMGKVREDFGLHSSHYGRSFARGTFRRGFTPTLTTEVFAETTGKQHSISAGITAVIATYALTNAAISLSEGDARGASLSMGLERSSRNLSFGLRGQYATRNFTQLGEITGLHYRFSASASTTLGALGSLNLIHAAESRYDRGHIATTAATYQKQIGKSLSVLTNFSATRTNEGIRRYFGLALIMPLDAFASATLSSTRQDGNSEHVFDARQNPPTDEGWAARGRLTQSDARGRRADAGVTWQNAFSQWVVDVSHASSGQTFRVGANGSLLMAGGVMRPVRQLGDAFGIVSVPGYPGIDVFHENQRVAQTDASGFAVIPRLRPFEVNTIVLDTLKLSLATELSGSRRTVTPGRRAGVLLQFKARKTYGALIRVLQENGEPVPAGASISIATETFPVAANGEAWVTGLETETDADVVWLDQRCKLRIPVPDATIARPRIGPLTCKGKRA